MIRIGMSERIRWISSARPVPVSSGIISSVSTRSNRRGSSANAFNAAVADPKPTGSYPTCARISSASSTSDGSSSTTITTSPLPCGSSFATSAAGGGAEPATGNQMVNVVPSSSSVATSIAPPTSATIPWTSDKPRPVPAPTPLVVKNGSNTRSSTLGSMPVPVSRTVRHTCGPGTNSPWNTERRSRTSTRSSRTSSMPPAGIACTAFVHKFITT